MSFTTAPDADGSPVEVARTPAAPGVSLPPAGADPPPPPAIDYYLNRELTWLNFARRVLHEARDARNPLLERVRFLAIVGSTLDEFFMKRMGGLKSQVAAGVGDRSVDGRSPAEQIRECQADIRLLEDEMSEVSTALRQELTEHDVHLVDYAQLSTSEQAALSDFYYDNIFPLVTPQAKDPAHPFPFISNLSLNLLAQLRYPGESKTLLVRVKVPIGAGIPRLLPLGGTHRFVPLEQVMAHNLDLLFPGMEVVDCHAFRVTRNANTEGDEDKADDLLVMIESELLERKFAPIVRVEFAAGMPLSLRQIIATEFELDVEADLYAQSELLGKSDLAQIADLDLTDLHFPVHRPIDSPELPTDRTIFRAIRDAGSILLHHPYESFGTSVQRFLREAGSDPKVRAIKMTLYRTSQDSTIVDSLVDAALHGKQVAVVVELKARFDEAANIRWASRLEEAGIHVSYGVVGLKTHCKVIMVVRQDGGGLRRYTHIGTGNYHAGNARGYTDLGLLTCDDAIGHDTTELFNFLTTGVRPSRDYWKLLVAPTDLKPALLRRIEREIDQHRAQGGGLLQMKINALEDADITRALYRAAQAGVKVHLIVRDTCRFRPEVEGLSEGSRVVSVLGRFLEHARIYYFRNGGDDEYFIGSADLMKRNLESRVEVLVPVESPRLRSRLREILDVQLDDCRSAWQMHADGSYSREHVDGPGCQALLIEEADRNLERARNRAARRT
jgi:polyphosphate kinase